MIRNFISIGSVVLTVILFSGCRKDVKDVGTTVPSNFDDVFELFWKGMNANYVYWDIDTTRWDAVYTKYKPIFRRMNLEDPEDVRSSVQLFREMTKGLIDGHFSISFEHSLLTDSSVNPAYDRKRAAPGFHDPYSYAGMDIAYLDTGYRAGYDSTTNPPHVLYALSGTIGHRILYFTCNQFALRRSYDASRGNGVRDVLQYFFDHLDNSLFDMKGLIIDLRSNGGGDLEDLNFLVGHLIDKPLLFGYTHYKDGSGRLDIGPWLESTVAPWPRAGKISVPMVVLTDNFSASASEAITLAIHALPGGIIVGERTWGATGPVAGDDIYHDGPFAVPGFLSVYTSSAAFKYLDGKVYEGTGFPPDIAVPFDVTVLSAGRDPSLEKGISLVK